MTFALDHLVFGGADLDQACAAFAKLSGVRPNYGGVHSHGDTHNAIAPLADGAYVEIIAPARADARIGWSAFLAALPAPRLFAWCWRSDDLDALARAGTAAGLPKSAPIAMGRTRPDGVRLEWRLYEPSDPRFGDFLPFFIDWGASPHPSQMQINGAPMRVRTVEVAGPEADALNLVFAGIGFPLRASSAPAWALRAEIETARGVFILD